MNSPEIKSILERQLQKIRAEDFISGDPIQIPAAFHAYHDIESAAFLTAIISWGRRDMIIKNAQKMMAIMAHTPYEFILHSSPSELRSFDGFVHRTFNAADTRYLILSLRKLYLNYSDIESVFTQAPNIPEGLKQLRRILLSEPGNTHVKKHISDITKGSAAKRLNMFLRWMVRKDAIDFGLWKSIKSSELYLPLDVHSSCAARNLGMLARRQNDWSAVCEVTQQLKKLDPDDPVKYDLALFTLHQTASHV